MARKKWKYFIGVYLEDGSLHYITRIDDNKVAYWEDETEAKEFGMQTASDICEGLNFNFIHSVVVKAPSFMNISNGHEK